MEGEIMQKFVTQTKKKQEKMKRASFKHTDIYAIGNSEVERYM